MGWLQVLLEPTARSLTGPLSAAVPQGLHPLDLVTTALTFRPQWSPSLQSLNYPRPHPDGVAATSYDDPATAEDRELLHLLLPDDGRVQALAPALSTYGRARTCISVNHLMELAHQLLQLAAHLGAPTWPTADRGARGSILRPSPNTSQPKASAIRSGTYVATHPSRLIATCG